MSAQDKITIEEVTTAVYPTTDIKMAASLVTAKFSIAEVSYRINPRNSKKDTVFGFSHTEELKTALMQYLSSNLMVDAKSVLDNKDSLLSFVTNGNKAVLESLNSK